VVGGGNGVGDVWSGLLEGDVSFYTGGSDSASA